MTAKPISHKFINWHDGDVRELTLYTDSGEEIITVSDEHPFWVIGKGWTDASGLNAYNQVLTLDNRIQLVKSNTRHDQSMVVYNFEIEDYHTFAVTDDAVWVHNCGDVDYVVSIPKHPRGRGSVPKEDRDPKRLFGRKDREVKRTEQDNKCATGCGTDIDASNSHGHHIEKHAHGGKTVPENHAEVCHDCHRKLHSK